MHERFQIEYQDTFFDSVLYIIVLTAVILFCIASCTVSSREASGSGPGRIVSLQTVYGIQYARVFGENDTKTTAFLAVVLHGDAPHGPPSYQYVFAEELAGNNSGSVVAALLRPGYSDPTGLRSAGRRGFTNGDNYTPNQLEAIAQAIKELRNQYSAKKVFLIGHSGGAAITASLMGQKPNLAHTAVLLSCPCDLALWREHMSNESGGLFWRLPVRSISPLSVVENIVDSVQVRLIVGSNDSITPPELSYIYMNELMRHGLDSELTVLPDRGHEILNDEEVLHHITTFFEKESNRNH